MLGRRIVVPAGTHFLVGSVGLRVDTIIEDAAQG